MTDTEVHLLGLDVGSTTTSALTATARVARDPVQGRLRLHDEAIRHRLGPVLTPLDAEDLDRVPDAYERFTAGAKLGKVVLEL
jgi:hypothetical protein